MELTTHRKYALFILVLFFIWGGLSYRWYTCGVKGFCGQTTAPEQKVAEPVVSAPTVKMNAGGTTETPVCPSLLSEYITPGAQNSPQQVAALEEFLNTFEGETLTVDGVYGSRDVQAVMRFQNKYRYTILTPYHLKKPTGRVQEATLYVINTLYCESMKQ